MKLSRDDLVNRKVGVVFSSGFFGFFAHAGFLEALYDLGIRPAAFAGSSSGAIVAAMAAAGMDSKEIQKELFALKKEDIWDPESWVRTSLAFLGLFRGWQGKIRGDKIRNRLAELLPVIRVEDTKFPCIITGTNLTDRKEEVFLKGDLADAVHASIAVPWLFRFKNLKDHLYVDGGLVDKAPLVQLVRHASPDALIVHYLPSKEIRSKGNQLLRNCFTPQVAFRTAMNIARHEHYLLQRRMVEAQGIPVIELTPEVTAVHPSRLESGRGAYQAAYDHCLSCFSADAQIE